MAKLVVWLGEFAMSRLASGWILLAKCLAPALELPEGQGNIKAVGTTLVHTCPDVASDFAEFTRLSWVGAWSKAESRQEQANQRSRRDFAKAMSKIEVGMTENEILALLGKPDDVQTQYDAGGIVTPRTKEIWRYGTNEAREWAFQSA
jgi:hypothetical protein